MRLPECSPPGWRSCALTPWRTSRPSTRITSAGPRRRPFATIASADALLIATPEYNASIPGQLKNALDWASRPFAATALRRKPVAVIGASTGPFGAVWAQAELRRVLRTIGARVVERELAIGRAHEAFGPAGRLLDRTGRDSLSEIVRALVEETEERPPGLAA